MSTVGIAPFVGNIESALLDIQVNDPYLVFFSGGTALSPLATCLKKYTKNAVYLITTFDSGGSSAVLRKAFSMPAVGDLRARLIALADNTQPDYEAKLRVFDYRLAEKASSAELLAEFIQFAYGTHHVTCQLSEPLLRVVKENIQFFLNQMPKDLDLSGASIGNILLTAKYLQENRSLIAAVCFFSQWLGVHGIVRPLVNINAHLCVELKNGDNYIGQHCFTGKFFQPIESPIQRIWLTDTLDDTSSIILEAYSEACQYIKSANIICFPMGSFFSSVIANLLPEGITEAIIQNRCPKVFIPNKSIDPESLGYSVQDQVEYLAYILGCRLNKKIYPDIVILDKEIETYPEGKISLTWFKDKGIQVIMSKLVIDKKQPYFDPDRLCQVLLNLL